MEASNVLHQLSLASTRTIQNVNLTSHKSIKKNITNEGADGRMAAIHSWHTNVQWKEDTLLQRRKIEVGRRTRILQQKERNTWEVIIALPGVEIIPYCTLDMCRNVKMVVMADTVKRIEEYAFFDCSSLVFRDWDCAFLGCTKLIILSIARHTTLGRNVIPGTALIEVSPFETNENGDYHGNNAKVKEWIQNLNQNDEYALHRECASFQPSENDIYKMIKERGLQFINVKNQIGLTAFECLQKNPYTEVEIDEYKLINKFVLDLLGEIIA